MAYENLIIIAIVAGILIFGIKKIPDWVRTFGKAKVEFERAKLEADKEIKDLKEGFEKK